MAATGIYRRSATMFTTPSDVELVATHIVAAPRRPVFEAHVDPLLIWRWMVGPDGCTMPVCDIDLREGGAWRYVWCRADGSETELQGDFREVTPPRRLVTTERRGGDWPETLRTTILTEDAGRTTVTARVRYPSRQERDRVRRTGMEAEWAKGYERLDTLLLGRRGE